MDIGNWLTIVGIVFVPLFAFYLFLYRLDKRVSTIESDNKVFWKVIGPHFENIIHSPKSKDRDALVAKLNAETIERDELPVLIELLHEAIAKPEWNNEKRLGAIFFLAHASQLLANKRYKPRKP